MRSNPHRRRTMSRLQAVALKRVSAGLASSTWRSRPQPETLQGGQEGRADGWAAVGAPLVPPHPLRPLRALPPRSRGQLT